MPISSPVFALMAASLGEVFVDARFNCFKDRAHLTSQESDPSSVNSNGPEQYRYAWISSQFLPPKSHEWVCFGLSRRTAVLRGWPRFRGLSVAFRKSRASKLSTKDTSTYGPTIQRFDPILVDYEYDYFPRGRVNWRKEDDRWLLVLDPKLNRSPFITHIVLAWNLPRSRLLVLTDAHYRSLARVGLPQQGSNAE